jgi:hypothetical protein
MSITYTWIINSLTCYPQQAGQTDVVFNVAYILQGTDGTYNGSITNSCGVSYTEGEPFTPYADLTQEQVIGWVQAALGPDLIASYEEMIASQIANQSLPAPVTPALPWSA